MRDIDSNSATLMNRDVDTIMTRPIPTLLLQPLRCYKRISTKSTGSPTHTYINELFPSFKREHYYGSGRPGISNVRSSRDG